MLWRGFWESQVLDVKGESCGLCRGPSAQSTGAAGAVFGCGAAPPPEAVDFVVLEICVLPTSSLQLFSLGQEDLVPAFHYPICGGLRKALSLFTLFLLLNSLEESPASFYVGEILTKVQANRSIYSSFRNEGKGNSGVRSEWITPNVNFVFSLVSPLSQLNLDQIRPILRTQNSADLDLSWINFLR